MSTTDDAASALEYIDAAISLATYFTADRLAATVENIEAYFRLEEHEQPPEFSPDEVQAFVALLIIEPDLLYDLTTIVHKTKDAYRLCLQNASAGNESDDCDHEAKLGIREILNHIRNRNEGELPTGILNNQWESFS